MRIRQRILTSLLVFTTVLPLQPLALGFDFRTEKLPKGVVARLGEGRLNYGIAYSPDGSVLATGSSDDTVKLWSVKEHRELITLVGHTNGLRSIAFSPDGALLASGSIDSTVLLWNTSSYLNPSVVAVVESEGKLPMPLGAIKRDALYQNYPNPFNPETWIPYQLETASEVTIHIYNRSGKRIRVLPQGVKEGGTYLAKSEAVYWAGRNGAGESVASGIYFYQLRTRDFFAIRRMLILK